MVLRLRQIVCCNLNLLTVRVLETSVEGSRFCAASNRRALGQPEGKVMAREWLGLTSLSLRQGSLKEWLVFVKAR